MRRAFWIVPGTRRPGLQRDADRSTRLKDFATSVRATIDQDRVEVQPRRLPGPAKAPRRRTCRSSMSGATPSMTYTLEDGYGSKITVPGAGFLLNNEMGDFNAGPRLTNVDGLIGTDPNLAQPGKRMLSSMTPAILVKNGTLAMVTGSPGGRTIINTVLLTILNVVDFGMNAQEAVDAGRFHHQWLPDRLTVERLHFSPDTLALLKAQGHDVREVNAQGVAEVIVFDARNGVLEGGVDRRQPDGAAAAP